MLNESCEYTARSGGETGAPCLQMLAGQHRGVTFGKAQAALSSLKAGTGP